MSEYPQQSSWAFGGAAYAEQGFRPPAMYDPYFRNMPHTDLGEYGDPMMEGFEPSGSGVERMTDHEFFNSFDDDCDDRDMAIRKKPPSATQQ